MPQKLGDLIESDRACAARAIELARTAALAGDEPFGAVAAINGKIIAEAHNSVVRDSNPIRHAETILISRLLASGKGHVLSHITLYSSSEPCMMCCGAIHWCNVPRLIFCLSAASFARIRQRPLHFECREVFNRQGTAIEIHGPLLEEEIGQVHESYWRKRRNATGEADNG